MTKRRDKGILKRNDKDLQMKRSGRQESPYTYDSDYISARLNSLRRPLVCTRNLKDYSKNPY